MSETVKVQAYCGFYVKQPKWRYGLNDWHLEPGECGWEDIIELDKEDWNDGFASINCPKCGATLTQDMDHFELINIPIKEEKSND